MIKKAITLIVLLLATTNFIIAEVSRELRQACTEFTEAVVIDRDKVPVKITSARLRSRGSIVMRPRLTLSMTVNGIEYNPQHISEDILSRSYTAKPGYRAKVFYNPANPDQSYMEDKLHPVWGSLFALPFLLTGIALIFSETRKRRLCTEYTQGIVVENEKGGRSKTRPILYPVFSITVNGVEYKWTHSSGSSSPKYKEGDRVNVYYNPANPKQRHMKEISPFFFGLICMLGGSLIIVSIFIY